MLWGDLDVSVDYFHHLHEVKDPHILLLQLRDHLIIFTLPCFLLILLGSNRGSINEGNGLLFTVDLSFDLTIVDHVVESFFNLLRVLQVLDSISDLTIIWLSLIGKYYLYLKVR
jgi:hypothetical protein